ncbi:MAG: Holliday junction resolvase RuvX [Phycisphaerae bacterium]|nr:Holliday junction resolvase RuvX [Phycisphaerae bacterium]
MRYLAVDLGDARTGLALGDDATRIVSPRGVLEIPIARAAGNALLDAVRRAFVESGAGGIVMGLPLNMDGSEGPRAKGVRAFASRLAERCPVPIELHDERLTTAAADWAMARSGLTHGQKKTRRDALAAAELLRDFLSRRAADSGPHVPANPRDTNGPGPGTGAA